MAKKVKPFEKLTEEEQVDLYNVAHMGHVMLFGGASFVLGFFNKTIDYAGIPREEWAKMDRSFARVLHRYGDEIFNSPIIPWLAAMGRVIKDSGAVKALPPKPEKEGKDGATGEAKEEQETQLPEANTRNARDGEELQAVERGTSSLEEFGGEDLDGLEGGQMV